MPPLSPSGAGALLTPLVFAGVLACTAPPTPAPPSGPGTVDVTLLPSHGRVLGQRFLVEQQHPRALQLRCRSPREPDEDHVVEVAPHTRIDVGLYGLLADTEYTCALTDDAGAAWWEGSLATEALPATWPADWVEITGEARDRYLVLAHYDPSDDRPMRRVVVVDPEGALRWVREYPEALGMGIEAGFQDGLFAIGGGLGVVPQLVDPAGAAVAVMPIPPESEAEHYHHEAALTHEGALIGLRQVPNTWQGESFTGFAITTWDPRGEEPEWTWESQRAVDAGLLPVRPGTDDPWHANAVVWRTDAHGDAVWVSLKGINSLVRIDRETGEITHQLGIDGDFTLLDPRGRPLPEREWFFGQHAPEFHTDRLWLYDNGVQRPGGRSTRVAEFALDLDARTLTLVWTWEEPDWFEPALGDVDVLDSGNVLVTSGHVGWSSYTEEGATSFVAEVDPISGEAVWRMDLTSRSGMLYRSTPVDGCALFSNRRYCR